MLTKLNTAHGFSSVYINLCAISTWCPPNKHVDEANYILQN
jgi:hypothetical protein